MIIHWKLWAKCICVCTMENVKTSIEFWKLNFHVARVLQQERQHELWLFIVVTEVSIKILIFNWILCKKLFVVNTSKFSSPNNKFSYWFYPCRKTFFMLRHCHHTVHVLVVIITVKWAHEIFSFNWCLQLKLTQFEKQNFKHRNTFQRIPSWKPRRNNLKALALQTSYNKRGNFEANIILSIKFCFIICTI